VDRSVARRHGDPATVGDAPPSDVARPLDRSTAQLRRLSRAGNAAPDREAGMVATSANGLESLERPGSDDVGGASGAAVRPVIGRAGAVPVPRPQIALKAKRVAARRTAAEPARRTAPEPSPPVAGTTDAGRLAAVTGGSLIEAPSGRASVVFPSAGQQAGGAARAAHTTTQHRALPEPPPVTAAIDVDDLYEQIAARLRRELLLDRERAGELP
jgi:hypothetical protein